MANSFLVKDITVSIGDTVRIHYAINDKDKKKNQIFEGIVLGVRGREENRMFTVRKMTKSKVGVERIFPIISPYIEKIEIAKKTTTTRAKVFYVRTRSEKEIRNKLYR